MPRDIIITQHITTVTTDTDDVVPMVGGRALHHATMDAIGEHYARVHWNEKRNGIPYRYNDGDTVYTVTITATVDPSC